MNKNNIYYKLEEILNKEDIFLDEPMKKHVSFRVGGPADILVRPRTIEQIQQVFKLIKELNLNYLIIGNGSNLIIKDGGIRGIVVEIGSNFNNYKIKKDEIEVEAGMLLSQIGNIALENSLAGFEFASGIPGSLGGAVAMNAGAYGGEMKNIIKSVTLLNDKCEIIELSNEQMNFGYRKSIVSNTGYIVLSAVIKLKACKKELIKQEMLNLKEKRTSKQPLEYPSAGSTFKRPEGYFAGKLIEDSGLKGFAHKGAMVSDKHSGFVINHDNANATEVLELIQIIKDTVYKKFNVKLEEEVKILGEDK